MSSNSGYRNLLIYNYGKKCWLGGKISRNNPLTYHHIIPVRDGGESIDPMINGALLCRDMHDKFNKLEFYYPDLAAEINKFMQIYKGNYPEEVWNKIIKLLDLVDRRHVDGKSKKYYNNHGY